MDITTTGAVTATTATSQPKSLSSTGKALGQDEFLQLFVSQLKNQDPLKPMDSSEFTAQLAQFSSLEQLFNINSGLQNLLSYQSSLNNGMVTGFIGKNVRTEEGMSGKVTGISFNNGNAYLNLDNGQSVTVGKVTEIFA